MKNDLEKMKVAIDAAKSCFNRQDLIDAYFAAAEEIRSHGQPGDMSDDEYAVYVDEQAFSMVPGSRNVMENFTDAVVRIYHAPSG